MTDKTTARTRPSRRSTVLTVVAAVAAAVVGGFLLGQSAESAEPAPVPTAVVIEEELSLGVAYNRDTPGVLDLVSRGQVVGSVQWPAEEECETTLQLPLLSQGQVRGSVEVCSGI